MMWLFVLICLVVLLAVGLNLFQKLYPPFGGKPSPADLKRYRQSPNYKGTKFEYPLETKMFKPSPGSMITALREYVQRSPQLKPDRPLPQVKLDRQTFEDLQGDTVVWFGHSALFLQFGGVRFLLDPMLGPATSPLGGGKDSIASCPSTRWMSFRRSMLFFCPMIITIIWITARSCS